jgi:hypothetical protein
MCKRNGSKGAYPSYEDVRAGPAILRIYMEINIQWSGLEGSSRPWRRSRLDGGGPPEHAQGCWCSAVFLVMVWEIVWKVL